MWQAISALAHAPFVVLLVALISFMAGVAALVERGRR